MQPLRLDPGAGEPFELEAAEGTLLTECRGPEGVVGRSARELVETAIASPSHGPPLESHVVPGDRPVIAVAGDIPQAGHVLAAVAGRLAGTGIVAADLELLGVAPLEASDPGEPVRLPDVAGVTAAVFDPAPESATSYLAADDAGRPLYLSRALVDADVVVGVGSFGWNAALGGRSLEGELWPTFSRSACRHELVRSLARRGRHALPDWRTSMQEITWQLGVCASLRLVAGRAGSLAGAFFGLPDEALRLARTAAAGWCPRVDEPVELTIASLTRPAATFGAVTRAVAAAARVTQPGGTICVASRVGIGPGIIFLRWRQGAPLEPLVHEAIASGDVALIADALETRLFARALGDRRLVLLSSLEEAVVEELGFGFAGEPDVFERLLRRADSVAVLHEADLMLPAIG